MQLKRHRVLSDLVTGLAVVLFATVGVASAQLLNPSFESPDASAGDVYGSDSWPSFAYVYTTAAIAHSGSQALKTFGPFAQYGGSGCTQVVPAAAGQTWGGEIWALNASFDPIDNVDFGVFKIEFLDAAMNFAAGAVFGVDVFESNPINSGC